MTSKEEKEIQRQTLAAIRELAQLYNRSGDFENAKTFYLESLEIDPSDYIALNNLGLIEEKYQNHDTAKEYYEKSLRVKENYQAYHNLGVLLRKEHDFSNSEKCLKKALKFKPDSVETKVSLGMTCFSKKDFYNGFKYYNARKPQLRARFENPWEGQKHPDKSLLLWFDGGNGDLIMFSRYLEFLKPYFKEIKMLTLPPLKTLLQANFPYIQTFCADNIPDYDISANIMEVPFILNMDFSNIPSKTAYLKAESTLVEFFKQKYFKNGKEHHKKIGLFWQGNLKVFKNRAITLKELEPLFDLDNTLFYSFEKDDIRKQICAYPKIIDLEPELKDFSATAGALMNIDILVTVDTAVAHLAGALGIKTCLLLPYASEWRWFEDCETTPWYDSVRIFRQEKEGEWEKPVKRLLEEVF